MRPFLFKRNVYKRIPSLRKSPFSVPSWLVPKTSRRPSVLIVVEPHCTDSFAGGQLMPKSLATAIKRFL
jgi:hypothetical protein